MQDSIDVTEVLLSMVELLTIIKGDVSAPVGLIEGLEVALPSIIYWTVPQLSAIIEDY